MGSEIEALTVEEAAGKLRLCRTTIQRMLRDGRLRGVKVGGHYWRVPARAIEEFLGNAPRPQEEKGEPR